MTDQRPATLVGFLLIAACGTSGATDAGLPPDSGVDAGIDAGTGVEDAGPDGGIDAGPDGGEDSGIADSGIPDSGFPVAAHLPLPTIPFNGGLLIRYPQVVTISYADFPYDASAIGDALTTASWASSLSNYNVRSISHLADYVIPDAGSLSGTDSEVQTLIEQLIENDSVPAPTTETLYLLFLDRDADYDVQGTHTCVGLLGYHFAFVGDAGGVVYGVAVPCSRGDFTGDSTAAEVSMAASHEVAEMATDPYPYPQDPGYADLQPDPFVLVGAEYEVADWCSTEAPIQVDGYWLSRIWSNQVAAQGAGDPCLPVPSDSVYTNVSIDPPGLVIIDAGVAAQTVTYTLTGWSTGAVSDWTVDLFNGPSSTFTAGGGFSGRTPTRTTINNGVSVTMQVVVPANTPAGSFAGVGVASSPTGLLVQGGIHYNINATAIYVQ